MCLHTKNLLAIKSCSPSFRAAQRHVSYVEQNSAGKTSLEIQCSASLQTLRALSFNSDHATAPGCSCAKGFPQQRPTAQVPARQKQLARRVGQLICSGMLTLIAFNQCQCQGHRRLPHHRVLVSRTVPTWEQREHSHSVIKSTTLPRLESVTLVYVNINIVYRCEEDPVVALSI